MFSQFSSFHVLVQFVLFKSTVCNLFLICMKYIFAKNPKSNNKKENLIYRIEISRWRSINL